MQSPLGIIIFGATSGIAQAVARRAAQNQDKLFLVARDAAKLAIVAEDLRTRASATVGSAVADFLDAASIDRALSDARKFLGRVDVVLIAHGVLPHQAVCQETAAVREHSLRVNLLSPVMIAEEAAKILAGQKSGTLAIIGSVAGDRGRQSNYFYGAAKGGLERFAQGLRNRLHKSGGRVVLVKPGFVDTPMTAHLRKGPLFAQPDTVARRIYRSFFSGAETIYVPWFWRFIMCIIKVIPESVFKKLSL